MKLQTMFFLAPLLMIAKPAQAQTGGRMSAMLDNADTDHDGRVTRAEYIEARKAMFDKLDRNHDGVVSPDDFGRLKRFRPKAADKIELFIKATDGDHDGRVTRAELDAAPTIMFDRMDANHDGAIDNNERAAAAGRKNGGA
jgi:Ca2+-binding EF-hand superfamily protein